MDKELDDTYLEGIRQACIDNDFCRYFELQGGHKVGKAKHYARPCRESVKIVSEHLNIETGEIIEDVEEAVNAYGEIIEEVVGVKTADQEIINRRPKWSIDWTSPAKAGSTQSLETIESFSIVPEHLFKIAYSDVPSSAVLEAYEVAMGWV
jgi:hypothetical protein